MSSYPHGTPSWVDLATTDAEASERFSTQLFGRMTVCADPQGAAFGVLRGETPDE